MVLPLASCQGFTSTKISFFSQKNWEAITYCSGSCRKNKVKPNSLDTTFESKILSLLTQRRVIRGPAATETREKAEAEALKENKNHQLEEVDSRAVLESTPEVDRGAQQTSRTHERCRQAARRLAARGEILITPYGKVVDPSFAKGSWN
jgi:hypothetical protein